MYVISKYSSTGNLLDLDRLANLVSFPMGSSKKVFKIKGSEITNIDICNKKMAYPIAYKKVDKKYRALIKLLTELLIDDDDSGESFREALNQIERFRMMIKNKYRNFLIKEEIEMMSKQLVVLQKEAKKRLMDIQDNYEVLNNLRSR